MVPVPGAGDSLFWGEITDYCGNGWNSSISTGFRLFSQEFVNSRKNSHKSRKSHDFCDFHEIPWILLEKLTSRDSGPSKVYGICNVYVGFTRRGLKSAKKIHNSMIFCANHTKLYKFMDFIKFRRNSMKIHRIPPKQEHFASDAEMIVFPMVFQQFHQGLRGEFVIFIGIREFSSKFTQITEITYFL